MPKTNFKSGRKIETGRNSLVKDPPVPNIGEMYVLYPNLVSAQS